jgi:tetratricopeptide (TPR) repeat protein
MDKKENTAKQLRRIRKLFEQKKFAKAEEVLREALSHDPDEPLFHIAHAVSFSKRRDHDAALKILDVAKERFPNHFSILYHRAEALYLLGKFQETKHEYRASLALTPVGIYPDSMDTGCSRLTLAEDLSISALSTSLP